MTEHLTVPDFERFADEEIEHAVYHCALIEPSPLRIAKWLIAHYVLDPAVIFHPDFEKDVIAIGQGIAFNAMYEEEGK